MHWQSHQVFETSCKKKQWPLKIYITAILTKQSTFPVTIVRMTIVASVEHSPMGADWNSVPIDVALTYSS